jgi:hypothetical protein
MRALLFGKTLDMKTKDLPIILKPQNAIDTVCDKCGGIYDLSDCEICMGGYTLCPECVCEENTLKKFEASKN